MTESTERVSWRHLVAEIVLADHLPMPTSIDLIGDSGDDESHLSLWTSTEDDKAVWEQFVGKKDGPSSWRGWNVNVNCIRRQTAADPLDDATKAALAAVE